MSAEAFLRNSPFAHDSQIDWETIRRQADCPHEFMSFMPPNEHREIWCCVACHKTFSTQAINELVAGKGAA